MRRFEEYWGSQRHAHCTSLCGSTIDVAEFINFRGSKRKRIRLVVAKTDQIYVNRAFIIFGTFVKMADAQLQQFLERLNQNKGDARNFISDKIATDLQQRGVLDDADVLEIRRSNFTAKTSKLIDCLVQKHQSGHQNVVQEFRSVLEKSHTQKHLAKLLPLPPKPRGKPHRH